MSIYARMMGIEKPKISPHAFMSAMQEYMLGNMTGAEVTAAFSLSPEEQAQALALRDRLLQEASQNSNLARRLKALEFENVLILAEVRIAPYNTEAAIVTRLGV